jgi:drug/metabolite transporter (DMT)-like permease
MPASVLILISAVMFGVSPIFAKVAYAHAVTPLTLLSLRATFGSLIIWFGLTVTRGFAWVPRSLCAPLLMLGATVVPFQVWSYFYALSVLPASSASVIANSAPVHVAWMGWLLLGEPLRAIDVVLLVMTVGGAALVAGQTPHGGHLLGFVVLASATLASAFYLVAQRRLVRDISPLGLLSVVLPSSAAVYWGVGLALTQINLSMSPSAFLAVMGTTVAASLGSWLVLVALQETPAAHAAMLGMLEPIVTVLLSVSFLGDVMTWTRAAGIGVVLSAIAALHVHRTIREASATSSACLR